MSVKETALLKIKTLDRRVAKQIRYVPYKTTKPSMFIEIRDALLSGALQPIGWVNPKAMDSNYDYGFWLVRWDGHYWWYMAPTPDSELGMRYAGVEQLFI